MKTSILTTVLVSGLTLLATLSASAQQDSVKKDINYGKGITINVGGSDNGLITRNNRDTVDASKGRFVGGITFTRFDVGFSKLIDNGSFSLSPANEFLDYKAGKTSHVSFDVLQIGYRFNSNFKIYVAGGFDWTLIRLKRNITIAKDSPVLTYTTETPEVLYEKNRFSSSYVHLPLNFELRSKENKKGNRFYLVAGPEIAFLINGKVKQISDEYGKVKIKDDYNFAPFRYGGTVRLGYGSAAIFAKYYANDMFDSAPQKGLKNMAFGLTLGLN
ncbi:outer membrane beta-barrel protein [Pedobacter cryotolerans]|uniref:PorT family protein n=1 Tax=Pedobacter cryotolerans TaxID=2571270 RepID=A0A4V6WMW3_9SPHI|nr:outer membrane beta-barrel protein [Pedobacter cryotolerans]TKB97452.1 PorT family protein [Pedobacter cryotolerans]